MTLTPQTANLLLALGENGRLKNVDSIINAFKTIMAAHRGEVKHLFKLNLYFY